MTQYGHFQRIFHADLNKPGWTGSSLQVNGDSEVNVGTHFQIGWMWDTIFPTN